MTDKPEGLSNREWEAVLELRKSDTYAKGVNHGLELAASIAEEWGRVSGGGTGEGGEGYRNLAQTILNRRWQER